MKSILAGLLAAISPLALLAQLSPTVSGDSLLCPNSTGIVQTQAYDSYQWYLRYFGSNTRTPIASGTTQTLNIDYATYSASYLSVFVTQGVDTATSPEFFVDGWAFLPPVVMTTGNFTTGTNGETIICEGDTVFFTLMQPYDTLITWYENNIPMSGATSNVLPVTTAGTYTCSGAPQVCPNFIQNLGVDLVVVVEPCSTGIVPPLAGIRIFPQPAHGRISVQSSGSPLLSLKLFDILGRALSRTLPAGSEGTIDLDGLVPGSYLLQIETVSGHVSRIIQVH